MDEKIKFLMVTTFYPPYNFGGDGIFVQRLSNELARRGHKVTVIHCVDAYRLYESRIRETVQDHPNVTVVKLKSAAGFLSPLLTQQTSLALFKTKKLDSVIRDEHFDVIHYHNMSLIGLNTLAFGDAIKLYTLHDYWLVCPMHTLWKYDRAVCTDRACVSCQIAGKRPVQWWRYSSIMRRAFYRVDAFIAPSIFTKKKYHELGFDLPITHIPNFLPSVETGSEPASVTSPRSYFLFVGRLEKIKGVQNLIAVFRAYKHADLLIVGDGEYRKTLVKLAQGLAHVRFLGWLPQRELRSLYSSAIAVLVPSVWYEVFGMIVVEAFAMRAPVIVSNAGALPELVEQSGGGFVYETESELIECMERLRLDPGRRRELGNRGFQAYQKYWGEDCYIAQYYQLIYEIAERKKFVNSNS